MQECFDGIRTDAFSLFLPAAASSSRAEPYLLSSEKLKIPFFVICSYEISRYLSFLLFRVYIVLASLSTISQFRVVAL
jgi:hypothetical protein